MTREDAKRIVRNIETIQHFADGGDLEYSSVTSQAEGRIGYRRCEKNRMILTCLDNYRPAEPEPVPPDCPCMRCPIHQNKETD